MLSTTDPTLFEAIANETLRQQHDIELIASENYASIAVMQAQGSVLTNKYAEGYPGKRYYGGCQWVDQVERLAIERACALFGAAHANVQPHSGASANFAVFFSLLEPEDTILGMDLACGGHLSHGMSLNVSGKWFNAITYGLTEHEHIDYDQVRTLALRHRPKLIIAGASAYSQHIDFAAFAAIAQEVDALLLADVAHYAGLIAAGLYPNAFPHADVVTTTTHKTLRGPRGGMILSNGQHSARLDKAVFPGTQGGPLMHVIAAKAVAFHEAQQPSFISYQQQVIDNAQTMARIFQEQGLRVVSGSTRCHLMMLDLTALNLSGKEAEALLSSAHITVNKNMIPNDPRPASQTSGIRIGTPAMTTRGMKTEQAALIAQWISAILKRSDTSYANSIGQQVLELTHQYPVYPT